MKYETTSEFPVEVRRIEPMNSLQNRPSRYSQSSDQKTRTSRAIRLAVYLYISAHSKLSDQQLAFVADFQARLNLVEIQKALEFQHTLTTDPRTRARMKITESSFEETLVLLYQGKPVPQRRPRPKIREQRRIGVGYRDKGSLRESHRPVLPSEVTLGAESYALFRESQVPQWVLRGERKNQTEVMSDWRKNPGWEKLPANHILSSESDWQELVAHATGTNLRQIPSSEIQ